MNDIQCENCQRRLDYAKEYLKTCPKCKKLLSIEDDFYDSKSTYCKICKDSVSVPKTKFCPKCKKDILLDDFGKNKTNKDGKQQYCKKCQSEYSKKSYEKSKVSEVPDEDNPDYLVDFTDSRWKAEFDVIKLLSENELRPFENQVIYLIRQGLKCD